MTDFEISIRNTMTEDKLKKRIVFISNHFVALYNMRWELIEKLLENKENEIFVIIPPSSENEFFVKKGLKVIEIPINRRNYNFFADIKTIRKIYLALKTIRPYAVLTYTIKPNIYGGFCCRLLNIPYFGTITGTGTSFNSCYFAKQCAIVLYRLGIKKAQCVFFQNESNLNLFKKQHIIGDHCRLVSGSGVNLIKFPFSNYPENDGTVRFLFIGRIMKEKGIEELLKCTKLIKAKYSNVFFDIVGFCEEGYEGILNRLSNENVIKYYGFVKDIKAFYQSHHAVVLPSYHEGMANVLLEASALGRPILASKIPGCQETFDEEITGLGFQPKSVKDLFRALEKFIQLPYEEKCLMGLKARQKMENEFDRYKVVQIYMEEIKKVL
ncbi:MAG: glycosyltransferase family 4 protein [Planctomycetia bacterium]|nr:glycosyltransferase family 4 protein [Planctomycetia bacterium]